MGLFGKKDQPQLTPARTVNLVKDVTGAPAVNLTKVRDSGHINLVKRADTAGVALAEHGLAGIRAKVILVLDHSGSMRLDYNSGAVQNLVERALAFGLQIDPAGEVLVLPFDSGLRMPVRVTVDNYQGVVNSEIWAPRDMGSTNMVAPLADVRKRAEVATMPVFCAVVTDGEPDHEGRTTDIVCDLSRYPVFLKFLALRPVNYLTKLDKMEGGRLLDNANAQPATGSHLNLLTCSDAEFAEAMVEEWDEWVTKAQKAGVLA